MNQAYRLIRKMMDPLQRRVRLMVARSLIELVANGEKCQTLQISLTADQLRDEVERFEEYGFTSFPFVGVEALVVNVGGSSDHPVVVAVSDRENRPTDLEEGEVALWTRQDGKRLVLKADGEVHVGTDPTDFVALAPATKAELDALRDTVDAHISDYNNHTHSLAGVCATAGGAVSGTATPTGSSSTGPAVVGEIAAEEVKAK